MKDFEQQYINIGRDVISNGQWIKNERTGVNCKAVISKEITMKGDCVPLLSTKQTFWKSAVAEFLGYLKGYDNAADFRKLGTKTWDANANETEAWVKSPDRKGTDDMGRVYGVIGYDFGGLNQFAKVYNHLRDGIDDRGEVITFWKPDEFHLGCLRPCMHTHQFSLVNGDLYLDSFMRSADAPLGLPFNMVQSHFFLVLMAHLIGATPVQSKVHMVNVHVYENQYEIFKGQMLRTGIDNDVSFKISDRIKTWEDVIDMTLEDIELVGTYQHKGRINYPFSA